MFDVIARYFTYGPSVWRALRRTYIWSYGHRTAENNIFSNKRYGRLELWSVKTWIKRFGMWALGTRRWEKKGVLSHCQYHFDNCVSKCSDIRIRQLCKTVFVRPTFYCIWTHFYFLSLSCRRNSWNSWNLMEFWVKQNIRNHGKFR